MLDALNGSQVRLALSTKARLTFHIWRRLAEVGLALKCHDLPALVERFDGSKASWRSGLTPVHLGRIVERVTRVGRFKPRCLLTALVLYRLLREQGRRPDLVIGLPPEPIDKDAHAWVELDGWDVGPPPGGSGHVELVRYG